MDPKSLIQEKESEYLLLESIGAELSWDQETYMPSKALDYRSEQMAYLQQQAYRSFSDPSLSEAFSAFKPSTEEEKAWLREIKKEHSQFTKLPEDHVVKKTRTVSHAHAAWAEAREKDDFSLFLPYLEKIVELNQKEADYLGWMEHPYDSLVEQFEPGMTTEKLKAVFRPLESFLSDFVARIAAAPQVDDRCLKGVFPADRQKTLGLELLDLMGYDRARGRLDVSAHPFTTTLGTDDVRVTTHYYPDDFASSLFSVVHEGGHGLYEQGVDQAFKGSFLSRINSLGLHESQSRFWENIIARSPEASNYLLPLLKALFPEVFSGTSADVFYRAINKVEPSFIRIEADEVTYNLHIILRFNLELDLLSGKLKPAEVPEAWNAEMKRLLGIVPPNTAQGCLQDIHWAMGTLGYFPTYTLGNLYSAQFYQTMQKDIEGLKDKVRQGDWKIVQEWLRENIHRHGSLYLPEELCRKVTGEALNPSYYEAYIKNKYEGIYSL